MKPVLRIGTAALFLLAVAAAVAGVVLGSGFLHPVRLPLAPAGVQHAEQLFAPLGAIRSDFDARAGDGVLLRGWLVRPRAANGDWVLMFHGVSDNRLGMLPYGVMLLRHGYGVVMMDARAHGESGGTLATYGWKERDDTSATPSGFSRPPADPRVYGWCLERGTPERWVVRPRNSSGG